MALGFLVVQDVEALIDTGALITGMSNVEVDGSGGGFFVVGLRWSLSFIKLLAFLGCFGKD